MVRESPAGRRKEELNRDGMRMDVGGEMREMGCEIVGILMGWEGGRAKVDTVVGRVWDLEYSR